jgi:hypothetical protein
VGLSAEFSVAVTLVTIYKLFQIGLTTFCLTLWEEHELRVSENKVLRRISEPRRDEMGVACRTKGEEEERV